jgi:CheY-like chemotaxis protein
MLDILYVEDDPNSRDVLRMVQRMNPELFNLEVFEDSEGFTEKLMELVPQPNLILLDIHMLPISGFEMLKRICTQPKFTGVPVVALTASVMNEEIELLQESGFHSVMSKPLDMDEFPEFIERIMEGERIWSVW